MPVIQAFSFYGYLLRPTVQTDFLLAEEWTNADPYHLNGDPMFWLEQDSRSESYLLHDEFGPVFFFKMMRTPDPHTIEFHIQFPPPCKDDSRSRDRMMLGLFVGLFWLEPKLRQGGIHTIGFESRSKTLIRFCTRRLGFMQHGNWLTKSIERGLSDVWTIPDADGASVRTG